MLLKQGYQVSDRGELVKFELAGLARSLEFVTALQLSAMLRREARFAKAASGNRGYLARMHGVLTNAEAPRWKQARWGKLPELLKMKNLSVSHEGALVCLQIGNTVAKLPYDNAFEISQALRVHGKLARNFAGEKAGWQKLSGVDLAVH